MQQLHVKLTLTEEMLGMSNPDYETQKDFIACNAVNENGEPDKTRSQEELDAIAEYGEEAEGEELEARPATVFPRKDGQPIMWDYQIKGMFKDFCGMLRRVPGTHSNKCAAFKKVIDGLVFVQPRAIPIQVNGDMGRCKRVLRANTPKGERTAIAESETVPAGSTIEFIVLCQSNKEEDIKLVKEWLDYGQWRGMGQWRNSGKGTFTWEEIPG